MWPRTAIRRPVALLVAFLITGCALGQVAEKEPIATLEVGAAGDWALTHGKPAYGPSIAVEATPIINVLEIEGGLASLFSHGTTEWDADFLVKKPYTLSKTVEFMAGVGPEWACTHSLGHTTNSVAGEAALDFMFWPSESRKIGWYIEPSYDYSFSAGHDQSVSVSLGVLIPIH